VATHLQYRHFADTSEAYAAGHHHNESVQPGRSLKTLLHSFSLLAPAKLNLRLEIGPLQGRLHTIVSVTSELALADELTFSRATDGVHVSCTLPQLQEQDNLAWRAVQALGLALPPFSIAITKRIPSQAGLGGGSSDAAAALIGCEKICNEQGMAIASEQLARAALEVGSDVPSFLTRGLKIVSGVGEVVHPFTSAPPPWGIVLLQPSCGSLTARAYALLDEAGVPHDLGASALEAAEKMCRAYREREFTLFLALLHNDFSVAIERAMPAIALARERLVQAGARATVLCGSGSCVAGFFESYGAAQLAQARVARKAGEWLATTSFGGST
jgi:4-diphosphocytidyl-2-C-methyl-D-erythritol kinase